jgi:hypothetical protein
VTADTLFWNVVVEAVLLCDSTGFVLESDSRGFVFECGSRSFVFMCQCKLYVRGLFQFDGSRAAVFS